LAGGFHADPLADTNARPSPIGYSRDESSLPETIPCRSVDCRTR
jgi:hypothetical protein